MLRRLRPSERVVVAFVAYAVVRVVSRGDLRLSTQELPAFDLFVALTAVTSVRLFAEFRRSPWPPAHAAARAPHLALYPVLVLGVVALVVAVPAFRPEPGRGGGAASEAVLAAYAWSFEILVMLAPLTLLWLAAAQHLKAHGTVAPSAILRARAPQAVAALRDWAPVVALLYTYGLMSPIIGRGGYGEADAQLDAIDRALFAGRDPRELMEGWISTPLSTWLSASYVLYVPLLPIVLGAVYARRDVRRFRELAFALCLVLATGYVGYTLVPAKGPLFFRAYAVPLDGFYGDWIKRDLLDPNRVPRDCFPSLHTAVACILSWGAYRHARPLFWITLPVVASIPLACVYFRYHYVVDVLAGLALAAGVAAVLSRRAPGAEVLAGS